MPSPNLPENVDSSYADETTDPSVKLHQQHHDAIHDIVNLLDTTLSGADDGDVPVWRDASSTYVPEPVSGTQGPQGDPGVDGADGVGFLNTGPWDAGTTYHIFSFANQYELAEFQGTTYVALQTHTNSPPPDPLDAPSANWAVFAQRGVEGLAGADGQDGLSIEGPQGPPGPSRESLIDVPDTDSGVLDIDIGAASYRDITLTADTIAQLRDSSGAVVSAAGLVITMGPGGPWTFDIEQLPAGRWYSTNGASPGDPPDLSGMAEGDEMEIIVRQVNGRWRGGLWGGDTGVITPPPDTFPTLGIEHVAAEARRQSGGFVVPTGGVLTIGNLGLEGAVQVGNRRLGLASLTITTNDSSDPSAIVTLQGGGVNWSSPINQLDEGGATPSAFRQRMFLFRAREIVSGPATTFTVTITGAPTQVYNSISLKVVQTTGEVPLSAYDLVGTSMKSRYRFTSGQTNTTATLTMDPAADPANRNIMFVHTEGPGSQTVTPTWPDEIVPEAGWTEIAPHAQATSPNVGEWCVWKAGATYDENPTATFERANVATVARWITVGCELEQG